jgi:uncharacterized BrkB/YihY/UPF0761 family membrane protein
MTEPNQRKIARRRARSAERMRALRAGLEEARSRHASLEIGFRLFEQDASIGGGLLAGALAYRLFILLLPSALLFVSGLGLYAGVADESSSKVAKEAGLHGLIASQVAETASGGARWLVFLFMLPAVAYALAKLYRALAITHAIVWHGSGRGTRVTPAGVGLLGAAFLVIVGAAAIIGVSRRDNGFSALTGLLVYLVLVGGTWLAVSLQLPHREARWTGLVPGALLVAVGLVFVNIFNVYITTRLVEDRANTYGALGIATALLFSLVLVGRLMIVSAELNAALEDRRRGGVMSGSG